MLAQFTHINANLFYPPTFQSGLVQGQAGCKAGEGLRLADSHSPMEVRDWN